MIAFPVEPIAPGRFDVSVPPDSAFFAGHFPGVPVLPGVVQLGIVLQALGHPKLAEIVHLRLRHPVLPGDRLELTLQERDTEVQFDLTRAGERVAHGILRLA